MRHRRRQVAGRQAHPEESEQVPLQGLDGHDVERDIQPRIAHVLSADVHLGIVSADVIMNARRQRPQDLR